ncbi:hypothetical protein H8S90_24930 [Olivibacter sp. SDN3]|uniref:hypothetical protein n=1 Tax=Olivibacter sp. SDN3 TaxID=2764720 RepID=UPI0016512B6A|nr:hypothetical protein [Olivibacter sp. SDN3]QNL49897.1 hypothetical protein H8S90_24930 [Olivibacter sp. SDN3]
MERLVVNIPESKSSLVKQILKGLGVTIQQESKSNAPIYKKKLTKVTTWSDEDVNILEESKKAFGGFKPQQ